MKGMTESQTGFDVSLQITCACASDTPLILCQKRFTTLPQMQAMRSQVPVPTRLNGDAPSNYTSCKAIHRGVIRANSAELCFSMLVIYT